MVVKIQELTDELARLTGFMANSKSSLSEFEEERNSLKVRVPFAVQNLDTLY